MPCSRTQHGLTRVGLEPRPMDQESEALTTRPPRSPKTLDTVAHVFIGQFVSDLVINPKDRLSSIQAHMSRIMRKPTFYKCENKDADQLRGYREADQRLCFRYIDSTIPLLSKSKISNL